MPMPNPKKPEDLRISTTNDGKPGRIPKSLDIKVQKAPTDVANRMTQLAEEARRKRAEQD
jgi:hypothetical protein